jgi:EAL domain-containing protein (putative c-di-GMP-specific phosphodiesterase class I)
MTAAFLISPECETLLDGVRRADIRLEPEIVQLDMSLVPGIDQNPVKHKLVGSMAALCRDMGKLVVAEGVETAEERAAVVDLGCELLPGYFFARPGPLPEPE